MNIIQVASVLRTLQREVHANSIAHGFYGEGAVDGTSAPVGNIPEKIALIHSELSEALENVRDGRTPDDKLPEYDGLTVELADVVIRVMDLAEFAGCPLAEALLAKHEYNKGRPMMHGRNF